MSDSTDTSAVRAPGQSTDPAVPTLYTTSWCPFCARLTRLLDERGVSYVQVDVDEDADAAAFVESVNGGDRVVPTVLYADGSTATNPGASKVQATLAELAGA